MHPTRNQQLAIRVILNALIGPGQFDRLCLGMRVECVLYVFVPNEDCAAKVEANYSDDLAVAAEQVFSQPIRIVNVGILPIAPIINARRRFGEIRYTQKAMVHRIAVGRT